MTNNFERIVENRYPLIRQSLNTCGLASLAMIFLHHSVAIKEFLQRLFVSKYFYKKSMPNRPVDANQALLWAKCYMLLKAGISRKLGNFIKKLSSPYEYMDFKTNLDLLFRIEPNRRVLIRFPDFKTLQKYYFSGIIRKRFLLYYLDQYKTQIELKILATMMGFEFVPYPDEMMGYLYLTSKKEDIEHKIDFMVQKLKNDDHGILLGRGQSHWMVLHSIYKNQQSDEYLLGINDPMGSRMLIPISRLDHSWLFWFFKYNNNKNQENLEFLKNFFYV
ncbi:MAG: hypothetical protein ACTSWN_07885 [Promethearchaeota archaeon]